MQRKYSTYVTTVTKLLPSDHQGPLQVRKVPLTLLLPGYQLYLSPGPHSIFSNNNCPTSQKAPEGLGQWAIARSGFGVSPPIM